MKRILFLLLCAYCLNIYSQYEDKAPFLYKIISIKKGSKNKIKEKSQNTETKRIQSGNTSHEFYRCFIPCLTLSDKRFTQYKIYEFNYQFSDFYAHTPQFSLSLPNGFKYKYSKCTTNEIFYIFQKKSETIVVISSFKDYNETPISCEFHPTTMFKAIDKSKEEGTIIYYYDNKVNVSKLDDYKELNSIDLLYGKKMEVSTPYDAYIANRFYGKFVYKNIKFLFINIKKKNINKCIECTRHLKIET